MLLEVSVSSWGGRYKEVTADEWTALRAQVPQLPATKPEYGLPSMIADDMAVRALSRAGLQMTVEPGTKDSMLVKLQDQMRSLGVKHRELEQLIAEAPRCVVQVAIPDLGLLQIDEVTWEADCCTQDLQRRLEEGWRILAVCPPNAQRRPDYILGRRRAA